MRLREALSRATISFIHHRRFAQLLGVCSNKVLRLKRFCCVLHGVNYETRLSHTRYEQLTPDESSQLTSISKIADPLSIDLVSISQRDTLVPPCVMLIISEPILVRFQVVCSIGRNIVHCEDGWLCYVQRNKNQSNKLDFI
jgi:hypothetical protein